MRLINILEIYRIVVHVHAHLADAHAALDLHFLDVLMDELLDLVRLADVLERQLRDTLIRRDHRHRADAENALPQRHRNAQIAHTVQNDLVMLDIQEAAAQEQPVLAQGVSREAYRHAEYALAVVPYLDYL